MVVKRSSVYRLYPLEEGSRYAVGKRRSDGRWCGFMTDNDSPDDLFLVTPDCATRYSATMALRAYSNRTRLTPL